MQASIDDRFRYCFFRVRAVVFCGTPHRGSDVAGWGTLAANLVAMAWKDSNTKLLSDLRVDSEILDMIQEDFLKNLVLAPDIRIHTFQEGRALSDIKGFDSKVGTRAILSSWQSLM